MENEMGKKGATQSGGGKTNQRGKDAAMAARMKKDKIERRSGRCAICNATITLSSMKKHIESHAFGKKV